MPTQARPPLSVALQCRVPPALLPDLARLTATCSLRRDRFPVARAARESQTPTTILHLTQTGCQSGRRLVAGTWGDGESFFCRCCEYNECNPFHQLRSHFSSHLPSSPLPQVEKRLTTPLSPHSLLFVKARVERARLTRVSQSETSVISTAALAAEEEEARALLTATMRDILLGEVVRGSALQASCFASVSHISYVVRTLMVCEYPCPSGPPLSLLLLACFLL